MEGIEAVEILIQNDSEILVTKEKITFSGGRGMKTSKQVKEKLLSGDLIDRAFEDQKILKSLREVRRMTDAHFDNCLNLLREKAAELSAQDRMEARKKNSETRRNVRDLMEQFLFVSVDAAGKEFEIFLRDLTTIDKVLPSRSKGLASLPEEDYKYLSFGRVSDPKKLTNLRRILMSVPKFQERVEELYFEYRENCEAEGAKPKALSRWLAQEVEDFFESPSESSRLPLQEVVWSNRQEKEGYGRALRCFSHPQMLSLRRSEPKAWNQILKRLDYPQEFLIWIWLLFSGEKCRQMAWIRGEGNDGKSTILNVLQRIMGEEVTAALSEVRANQFTASKFLRKRLVTLGDTKKSTLLSDSLLFQLTGGDYLDMEKKNQDSFVAKTNAMVLVASNRYPRIDVNSKAFDSRLLLFNIESLPKKPAKDEELFADNDFEEQLFKERYHLLGKAYYAYKKRKKRMEDNRKEGEEPISLTTVPVPFKMKKEKREKCKHLAAEAAERFTNAKLTFDEKGSIRRYDLYKLFAKFLAKELGIRDQTHVEYIGTYLGSLEGCSFDGNEAKGVRMATQEEGVLPDTSPVELSEENQEQDFSVEDFF